MNKSDMETILTKERLRGLEQVATHRMELTNQPNLKSVFFN